MEVAGNTATSIFYATYNILVRAGEFEDEFERHQLELDTLKMRLEVVRTIMEEIPKEQRKLLAQILGNSQRIFFETEGRCKNKGLYNQTNLQNAVGHL